MDYFVIKVVKRLVIFMLLVCGRHAMSEENAPYFKYVDEIVKDYLYEMQKDYGLVCAGRGGCMATRVESIDIFFDVYRQGSLEEARELFVKAQTRLVEKVNAHEKIRPFLKEYPFTRAGTDISLSYCKKDGTRYYDDSVAFVCRSRDGKIAYQKVELQTYESPGLQLLDGPFIPGKIEEKEVFVDIIREANEEAIRIVYSNKALNKAISDSINKLKEKYGFYSGEKR